MAAHRPAVATATANADNTVCVGFGVHSGGWLALWSTWWSPLPPSPSTGVSSPCNNPCQGPTLLQRGTAEQEQLSRLTGWIAHSLKAAPAGSSEKEGLVADLICFVLLFDES